MGSTNNITLDKELEEIIKVMQNHEPPLISPELDPKKILEDVKAALENSGLEELSKDDLRNQNIQKLLIGTVIAVTLGLDKTTKELVSTINTVKSEEPDEVQQKKIDNQLTAGLKLLQSLMLVLNLSKPDSPRPEPGQKTLKEDLEELEKEKNLDADKKEEITLEMREFEKQLEMSLRNLNGGDDPRIEGEIPTILTAPIAGNLFSFTHQTAPDPNSMAAMTQEITHNLNREDPLGLEKKSEADELRSSPGEPQDDLFSNVVEAVTEAVNTVDKRPTLTQSH